MFYRTYVRFRQAGVSSTLQGRLHLLAANAINVLVYLAYWSLFAVPYFLTYQVGVPRPSCGLHASFRSPLLAVVSPSFVGVGRDYRAANRLLLHFVPRAVQRLLRFGSSV